jgi:hypothetical protein
MPGRTVSRGPCKVGRAPARTCSPRPSWVTSSERSGRSCGRHRSGSRRPTPRGGRNEDGTQRTFDPLLPDTQRWHGRFDLFGLSNIIDFGGSLELTPATDFKAQLGYRYARLAAAPSEWIDAYGEPVRAVTRRGLVPLGHEASVGLSYEPLPGLTFSAAYAALFVLSAARGSFRPRSFYSDSDVRAVATDTPPDPWELSHYAFVETRLKLP